MKNSPRCNMCGKFRKSKDLSFQPSRRTLIFGMSYGRVSFEYRCTPCEKKLVKEVRSLRF